MGLTEGNWQGLITWAPGTSTVVSVTVGFDGKAAVTDSAGLVLTPEDVERAPLSDLVKEQ